MLKLKIEKMTKEIVEDDKDSK